MVLMRLRCLSALTNVMEGLYVSTQSARRLRHLRDYLMGMLRDLIRSVSEILVGKYFARCPNDLKNDD